MNLQHIIKLLIATNCRGRLFGLLLRYLAVTERVSCKEAIDTLSWSQTIIRYSTISGGRMRGLTVNLLYLMISLLVDEVL